jgi:hypothetical protein
MPETPIDPPPGLPENTYCLANQTGLQAFFFKPQPGQTHGVHGLRFVQDACGFNAQVWSKYWFTYAEAPGDCNDVNVIGSTRHRQATGQLCWARIQNNESIAAIDPPSGDTLIFGLSFSDTFIAGADFDITVTIAW